MTPIKWVILITISISMLTMMVLMVFGFVYAQRWKRELYRLYPDVEIKPRDWLSFDNDTSLLSMFMGMTKANKKSMRTFVLEDDAFAVPKRRYMFCFRAFKFLVFFNIVVIVLSDLLGLLKN